MLIVRLNTIGPLLVLAVVIFGIVVAHLIHEPAKPVSIDTCQNKTGNITREIDFGVHENHISYDGSAEKILNINQGVTVTLVKLGTYHWHDHNHDKVVGYFTVTNRKARVSAGIKPLRLGWIIC